MHPVGFEPTRPKPDDLKSSPLDHSGIDAFPPPPTMLTAILLSDIPMLFLCYPIKPF